VPADHNMNICYQYLFQLIQTGIGHFGFQENEAIGVEARLHALDFMKRHLTK
jgi:hypothetical protein